MIAQGHTEQGAGAVVRHFIHRGIEAGGSVGVRDVEALATGRNGTGDPGVARNPDLEELAAPMASSHGPQLLPRLVQQEEAGAIRAQHLADLAREGLERLLEHALECVVAGQLADPQKLLGLVGHQDDADTLLASQVLNQPDGAPSALAVQRGGGLVREDQLRLARQSPRDGDPLLLAAGELAGMGA